MPDPGAIVLSYAALLYHLALLIHFSPAGYPFDNPDPGAGVLSYAALVYQLPPLIHSLPAGYPVNIPDPGAGVLSYAAPVLPSTPADTLLAGFVDFDCSRGLGYWPNLNLLACRVPF